MNARDDRFLNRTQMLLRGLYSSGLCVMYHDTALRVRLVENAPDTWPSAETILAEGDAAIFGRDSSLQVIAAKRRVLATGVPVRIEAAVRSPGQEPSWFDLDIEPDFDPKPEDSRVGGSMRQRIRGLFVSATDITQLKRREEVLRSLLYEVSHRSRNMLAILQSILGHTARHSDSIAAFERKFRGRIASLAHSQDLITSANWHGVQFRRLAESQLLDHVRPEFERPPIGGDDPVLSPNTTLYIGLAIHELATNSARYGALASGRGGIDLGLKTTGALHRLHWIEEIDPPREGSHTRGFGQAILERVVARAVNGRAEYRIEPVRISYSIEWAEPERT